MEDNLDLSKMRKKVGKKVNSRQKGSAFERKVCKILNTTFNTTEFNRSPGSGAYATTHNLPEYLKIYGDIITPSNFKFNIECKKGYNNINLYSLLDNSSKFWEFVEKAEKDSLASKKEPMVLYQQDRQPILAIVRKATVFVGINAYTTVTSGENVYRIYKLDDLLKSSTWWFTVQP